VTEGSTRILLLFLDGVGIGLRDEDVNPFLRADLPTLRDLLGGIPTLDAPFAQGPTARAFPLDANLGMPGLPQSGTGQISLLTGRNAAALFGRHFGPWPPVSLRPVLHDENLLSRARAQGRRVAFANPYPSGWPGGLPSRRHAAPPLAALAAGVLDRDVESLVRGEAVASEIVNDGWIRYTGRTDLPRVTAEEAGGTLAAVASTADLTLFAHYHTDHAGHRGGMDGAIAALERVDAFLAGLVRHAPRDLVILGCSDHGNIEDVRGGHTRNPALGFVIREGGSDRATEAEDAMFLEELPPDGASLIAVAPLALALLGVQPGSESPPV
jgi:2,3-bisphosphoglycerate-independent phosphoglycerate mutase